MTYFGNIIPNMSDIQTVVLAAVTKILRPLVRVLLRNNIPYGGFADLAKKVYVDVATEEFGIPGRKQTTSRVSIITGLSRKEVHRVRQLPAATDSPFVERYNRAARVISGWVRDERFSDHRGRPATLPVEGKRASFSRLVRTYSGDVPPRAVLDELLRVGAIERLEDGRVRLLTRAYVPAADASDKISILGTDVSGLLATIDHNLQCPPGEARFQRKVAYDNLPEEAILEFKKFSGSQAQKLLEKLDRWLSARDRDVNPKVKGTGRMVAGVGIYYFEDSHEGEK